MTKLNITKQQFEQLYYEKTNDEICKLLNICSNTLWRWKCQLSLPDKKRGRKKLNLEFQE